jgi:hypothetical protein
MSIHWNILFEYRTSIKNIKKIIILIDTRKRLIWELNTNILLKIRIRIKQCQHIIEECDWKL